ncbi:unnamed protein product [Eruca vesicaria subsp. sativa]|uniref:Uncharacterized protein n=1 Tax=Eruca vesicaria subsp. sativa TaxID=29727 RepID=A0ABC8LNV0_ERUVS|nr:unnamed protein product [Eruca vesicaria subsp. sativa]
MLNPWDLGRRASASPPSSITTGDKRNLIPPDPPDPQSQLPLSQFPILSPIVPSKRFNRSKASVILTDSVTPTKSTPTVQQPSAGRSSPVDTEMELEIVYGTVPTSRSETTVPNSGSVQENTTTLSENLTILPPKSSSPLQTNKACSNNHTPPSLDNSQLPPPTVAAAPLAAAPSPSIPVVTDPNPSLPSTTPPLLEDRLS